MNTLVDYALLAGSVALLWCSLWYGLKFADWLSDWGLRRWGLGPYRKREGGKE